MTNTIRRLAIAAAATIALVLPAALPAQADTFPCQYDASTPHSLVVLAGTHTAPHARWTALYSVHGVPVTIRRGRLGRHGRSIRRIPAGWTDASVHVWVAGQRCETT